MSIEPFGWNNDGAPDITSGNLEAMHAASGAYTDGKLEGGKQTGTGDLLGARVTTPPAAHFMDLRDGTLTSPVKKGVTFSLSRTDATTRAEVNEIGPVGTDGPDGATGFRSVIKGAAGSQVQVVAVEATAWQTGESNGGEASADACAFFAFARTTNNAVGRAICAYFESSRETATSNGQQALEIRVKNNTGVADTYSSGTFSTSMGIELNPSGTADSACGIEFGHGFSRTFDRGIAFHPGAITGAVIEDNTEAERGLFVTKKHAKGAIVLKGAENKIVVNREEPTAGSHMFELFAGEGETFDPIARFGGSAAGINVSLEWKNSLAQMKGWIASGAKAFLPEAGAGDIGFSFTPGKTFHIGAITVAKSVFKVGEKSWAMFGHALETQQTVALGSSADQINEALKKYGVFA